MKNNLYKRAFTLVELLVVIAIIAILTAVILANLNQSKAKARDAKRVSDLSQIQLALEFAFDKCNVYPPDINSTATEIDGANCKNSSGANYTLGDFISQIPKDGTVAYPYGRTGNKYDYRVRALLEVDNSVLLERAGDAAGIDCTSNAKYYCVSSK